MNTKTENLIKDYLLIAVLVCFIAYKLPLQKMVINEANLGINLLQYQNKKDLIRDSVMKSGIRLLDIKLELDSSSLRHSNELVARTKFDSFGNVPTLISLDYVITDSLGREVYREIDEIVVETEKVFTKDFKKLNLKQGQYTITLKTEYNTDVRDSFKQTFFIKGPSSTEILSWGIIILGLLIITASMISKLFIKKGKQNL